MQSVIETMSTEEQDKFLALANRFEKSQKGKLNPDTILLSEHGYKRADERFGIKDRSEALKYFRGLLRKAVYISEVVEEGGTSRTHLYGVFIGNFTVVSLNVNLSYEKIVTIMKFNVGEYGMPKHMRDKVMDVHRTELNMLNRKENACLKKIDYVIAEANAEIYPLRFEIMKTTSEKKKQKFVERIAELEKHVKSKHDEIEEIQTKIRQVAKSTIIIL